MSDPVPAIAEASATGAVAEIFADIRTVLGVEVVNLIWRHLATIPDALPWAWGMLRPLYADGTIRSEARALHTRIALPHLPPFPHDLLAAVGLGGDDLADPRAIHCKQFPVKQIQLAAQQDKFTEDPAEGIAVVAPKISDGLEVRLQVAQQPDHLDIAVRLGLQPTARPHPV